MAFGIKAHIGLDVHSGPVHIVVGTATTVVDVSQVHALLHGDETDVPDDAGYQGVHKGDDDKDLDIKWHVAIRAGMRMALGTSSLDRLLEQFQQAKPRIQAKVEHPYHVVKNLFPHRKTRYRGLAKNTAQFFPLFGLAKPMLARRRLLAFDARSAS